jgi:hypothetical protein
MPCPSASQGVWFEHQRDLRDLENWDLSVCPGIWFERRCNLHDMDALVHRLSWEASSSKVYPSDGSGSAAAASAAAASAAQQQSRQPDGQTEAQACGCNCAQLGTELSEAKHLLREKKVLELSVCPSVSVRQSVRFHLHETSSSTPSVLAYERLAICLFVCALQLLATPLVCDRLPPSARRTCV